MGDERRITLGDYGRLDNFEEVSFGFQPANPVVFDIKNNVMMNLKSNQFSGKESEDCNANLSINLALQTSSLPFSLTLTIV